MSIAGFVLKNALRNGRRALLTILSVAISCALLVTLMTLQRELTVPPESESASFRIIARNKVSLAQPLPARQITTIEKLPGVRQVSPFTYFGGLFRDETVTSWAQFAVDPARFRELILEGKILEGTYEAWVRDRNSCLMGADTMRRYGLKVGDSLRFRGTFYPVDLQLTIAAVYAGTVDDRNCFFHHALLDQLMDDWGMVGTWYLIADSADAVDGVLERVNAAFENTSAEVRAETERAFQLGFISMIGNVKLLFGSISAVVVFTLILVCVSTMSMAIRERFRELAVLKALGFRRRELFAFILAESFGLSMLGAVVGIGGAWLFWSSINLQKLTQGFLVYFEVTPRIMATGGIVAALLGILAALGPSVSVARTSVVAGLKTLD
ncbi:MAG: FtsX-like permease family protein [Verrucomicrobia bacterium]|nr:FtsX-like permease family protein [Verrucomicrobiota bacterium]